MRTILNHATPACFLLVLLAIGNGRSVVAQEAPQPPAPAPMPPAPAPQNPQPAFYVRAQVNHTTRSYREGDALSVTAVSEVPAHLYVFYHQADGKTAVIFPNKTQPANRVDAKQPVQIPGTDDLFRWRVSPPFGKERITVYASKEPLDSLALDALIKQRFTPITQEQVKGVELELGQEPPADWGSDQVEITTYPKNEQIAASPAKRVGLFVGVSQYLFNTQVEAATGGKDHLNLATCHRDARQLAAAMREVGEVTETRVLTNEEATRPNIEQAITQWLPATTQPGDTVVLFFSGHGGPIPDDNGDERDGKDELIMPHDFVSPQVFVQIIKEAKEGKLPPAATVAALRAVDLVKRAGTNEKAGQALARGTGISDDLFGAWMQRLAGRQVIVILDACHSGGFATEEKDLFATAAPSSFDFVDREIGRLKDLGQTELVMLSACSTATTAAVRQEEDLSVLTYYLLKSIKSAPAQLTLPQAHADCQQQMREYFEQHNRVRVAAGKTPLTRHEPFLFNYCTQPVWLKP